MTHLIRLHDTVFDALERNASWLVPTLARLVFAGVLLMYFWNSALTKLGEGVTGLIRPSLGAYAQIFPRQMEAIGYDVSQLGVFHWLVVVAGTWAEILLPLLVLVGLATRLAALGMIGFVVVQSATDIVGHGADAATVGGWFDRISDANILDQRAFWVFVLIVLVLRGAGPLSVDALLRGTASARPAAHP